MGGSRRSGAGGRPHRDECLSEVAESALTGESAPVAKDSEPPPTPMPHWVTDPVPSRTPGDPWTATLIVTDTGSCTEMVGQIAGMLNAVEPAHRRLQKEMGHLTIRLI